MLESIFKSRLITVYFSVLLAVFMSSNVLADDKMTDDPNVEPQESTVTTTTVQPSTDGTTATKTVETRRTVVTTIPAPNVDAETPPGSATCASVDAAWQGDTWIPAHKICKYENSSEGIAWIEGYWQCTKVTMDGTCTVWEWMAGRWQN